VLKDFMNLPTVEQIEAKRLRRKLPIRELCRRASIPESTYRRWIRGLHRPRVDLMQAVVTALDGETAA
jgi:hypothetical protein